MICEFALRVSAVICLHSQALAEVLEQNSSLTDLNLERNGIGFETLEA